MATETTIDYEALLYALHQFKDGVKDEERDWIRTPFGMDERKAIETLRDWMRVEGRDEFHDAEHGITGTLTSRKTVTWDIHHAPDDLILALAHGGYLDVKTKLVDDDLKERPSMWLSMLMERGAGGLYKYRGEGEIVALRITEDPK